MVVRPARDEEPVVLVIRSAYETDPEWTAAIERALRAGRRVKAIDAAGRAFWPKLPERGRS